MATNVSRLNEIDLKKNTLPHRNHCFISTRSQTCPQCRENCSGSQLKRIYIDFACDEDLACAMIMQNTKPAATSSDAEEMIKILLEHIEKPEHQMQNHECDCCEMFQEALNNVQKEKDQMVQSLDTKERENENLFEEIERATKRIEELEMGMRASEHNMKDMKDRLDTSETSSAAIQSENVQRRDTIDYLKSSFSSYDDELKTLQEEKQDLTNELKEMTNKCDKTETERSKIAQSLEDKEREHGDLLNDNQNSLKRIEELQTTISTNNTELEAMRKQIQELNDKLKEMIDKHAAELNQTKKDNKRNFYKRFHGPKNNQYSNNIVPNDNQNNQNNLNTQNTVNTANDLDRPNSVPNNNHSFNKNNHNNRKYYGPKNNQQNNNRQNYARMSNSEFLQSSAPNLVAHPDGEPSSMI